MRPPTILCVEDNKLILGALKDTLELEGWHVEGCQDGTTALVKINTHAHYDLITLDHDLPGVSGLELLRHARTLTHRRLTPIVMCSASNIERETRLAGANAFMKKPDGLKAITETVARLLAGNPNHPAKDTANERR
jgi:CheY-like chemotaxis protein